MAKVGLVWFDNDLRLHDNPSLSKAAAESDMLLCVYCFDPDWLRPNRYGLAPRSENRWRFLKQSLLALDKNLGKLGQQLIVCYQPPCQALGELLARHRVNDVYKNRSFGIYENRQWQALQRAASGVAFHQADAHTLYDLAKLPFPERDLPKTFTDFRHQVENLPIRAPLPTPDYLPVPPPQRTDWLWSFPVYIENGLGSELASQFPGGEAQGLAQMESYFAGKHASHYKSVRDALDGWNNSTKLSPWLSNGCLSPRRVYARLKQYEAQHGGNESTYWIFFELLWREFFQWYAHCYGSKLFHFQGIKTRKPFTSYYPERFQKWCHGTTPYPLVNACMKQLNSQGYLSNRARQIAASCLVNELSVDWRYGAAYFEQQLIDYDVACNWGNWQYLGGVGADPRGRRHFDLQKQARQFDPDDNFVEKWQGADIGQVLDSVDAADWPVAIR